MDQLLTYSAVKQHFGWKSKSSIQDAVKKGLLMRVFLTKSVKSARITLASVVAYQTSLTEVKDTIRQMNIPKGTWAAWTAARTIEDEQKAQAAIDPAQVADPSSVTVNQFGDQFAPSKDWSEDPISGQLTPPGCYRDETDTLIFGLPSPAESQHIFIARCKLRGIKPVRSKYLACIIDGRGRWRVNDVPKEKQSTPALVYTPRVGTLGHA